MSIYFLFDNASKKLCYILIYFLFDNAYIYITFFGTWLQSWIWSYFEPARGQYPTMVHLCRGGTPHGDATQGGEGTGAPATQP